MLQIKEFFLVYISMEKKNIKQNLLLLNKYKIISQEKEKV